MRLAFIGGFGHHYLRRALTDAACDIDLPVAFCGDGHDNARAKEVADKLDVPVQWFADASEMFDVFRPDAVSVGAIYGYNGDWIAAALERNIPVVSDKPIAGTWKQLDHLRSLLDRNTPLLTEFDFHSRPEMQAAREAVAGGKIGDVVLVTGQKSYKFGTRPKWYADRVAYTGTMLWIASHAIDAVGFVSGKRVRRVIGTGGNVSHPVFGSMEDHVAALFELQDGGTALIHADLCRPAGAESHGDDRVRVIGSKGVVEVRDFKCRLITHDHPEREITTDRPPRPIHHELLAALRGEPSAFYSTQQSLATAELLLHTRDAQDGHKWIEIPQ